MNTRPILLRLAALLVCVCTLLNGCGAIRTLYNQADHVVAWRLNDYFGLSDEQRALLHARFETFHRWHRRTQLAAYIGLMDTVERRLARGPNRDDVEWLHAQALTQARASLTHAQADIAAFLSTLSEAQIDRAQRHFERDNRKYVSEHGVGASTEEQRRLRAKLDIERIEHWSGPLSRAQRARLTEISAALPLDADLHLRNRIRRQQSFVSLLAERTHPERFTASLRRWLQDWDDGAPSDLTAQMDRYDQARTAMLIEAYALLDAAQQRKVAERVRWYADALRDLADPQRG